ncbi:MAG: GNAT family N-acetyltransferase, partial [Deltaproteobacteria bacterium]|nr:GNAT family N-acetyltransferase [Deltaproteobacteria bacterium]
LVLDTRLELKAANRLYEEMGFEDIDAYNTNPRAQRFMALNLL